MDRVAVIMPVSNGMPFLPTTISSILSQTYETFDYFIFDDGSTDGTVDYLNDVASHDTRVFIRRSQHPKPLGVAAALNACLAWVNDESRRGYRYVARMDADDVAHSYRLESQVHFLDRRPDVDFVFSRVLLIDSSDRIVGLGGGLGRRQHDIMEHDAVQSMLLQTRFNPLCHPTAMWRINTLNEVGKYNDAVRYAEDLDLWIRAVRQNKRFAVLAEPLLSYRIHSGSVSRANLFEQWTEMRSLRNWPLEAGPPSAIPTSLKLVTAVSLILSQADLVEAFRVFRPHGNPFIVRVLSSLISRQLALLIHKLWRQMHATYWTLWWKRTRRKTQIAS